MKDGLEARLPDDCCELFCGCKGSGGQGRNRLDLFRTDVRFLGEYIAARVANDHRLGLTFVGQRGKQAAECIASLFTQRNNTHDASSSLLSVGSVLPELVFILLSLMNCAITILQIVFRVT